MGLRACFTVQAEQRHVPTAIGLKLGWAQAVSLWPATLLLFLCRTALLLCSTATGLLVLKAFTSTEVTIAAAAAGLGTAWVLAHVLRALVLGGALRQAALRLREQPPGALAAQAVAAAPRSLAYLLFGTLLELAADVYRGLLLLVTGWLYVEALGQHRFGALSAAGLALALTLLLPVALAARLVVEVALARSAGCDEGYLTSLYEAAGALWRRPWPWVSLLVNTGLLAWGADLAFSGTVALVASPASGSFDLAVAGHLASGMLLAFVAALLELARLDAFLALELDARGELPRPPEPEPAPPPEPIVSSEPVLTAEPIVSALPVPPGDKLLN